MIDFFYEDVPKFHIHDRNIKQWVEETVKEENKMMGNISIIFCSDDYLININRDYLKHDYYTDIITFDYSEENIIGGDLFISVDMVSYNAKQLRIEYNQELYRVIIHGILHLLGYNDKSESEKLEMRNREDYYLKRRDEDVR